MHKIKTILTLLLLLALHMQLPAQRTTVKDMRNRVKRLQQQIKEKESILYTSEKDIKSKIKSLQLLTSQADEQKTLIDLLSKELKAIDAEIKLLDGEITAGEAKVEKSKKEYAAALSRARRYGTLQDKLLFIISADDFNKKKNILKLKNHLIKLAHMQFKVLVLSSFYIIKVHTKIS